MAKPSSKLQTRRPKKVVKVGEEHGEEDVWTVEQIS